jgi:NitT/TauT family transport system substrate-binding protein
MRNMRIASLASGLLALTLALTGCGQAGDGSVPEAESPPGVSAAGSEADPGSDAGSGDGEQDIEPVVVRVGFIPVPAPATHLLLADERGYFEAEGITIEATPFDTGITLSEALTGGSIDIGVMGAVIANFPARGQGKTFLLNNLEANIQQIWASADSGISSVEELADAEVATTTGTAAHLLLHVAFEDAGIDSSQVEIVNLDMPSVANSFVTGNVDAAALWAPFDQLIEERASDAVLLATSGDYEDAAIAGGWVANNTFYDESRDVLQRIIRAWLRANDDIDRDQDDALDTVCPRLEEYMEQDICHHVYAQTENFTNAEWREMYADGTSLAWVRRMEEVFVVIGALEPSVSTEDYFDTSLFLEASDQ